MSSFVDACHEVPRPMLAPRYFRSSGGIRAFVASALASLSSAREQTDEPQTLPGRYEAVIAAARSAFGDTIAW